MSTLLSVVPIAIWTVPLAIVIFGALIWYALLWKNHVSANFSHGKTKFRIEASGNRRKE